MGWIGEIVEGTIKGVYALFTPEDKKKGGWELLHKNEVPNWVERKGHRFHKKHPVRNHTLRITMKGRYYLYRIYFTKAAHRSVEELLIQEDLFVVNANLKRLIPWI